MPLYIRKSVPASVGIAPGAAKPKNPNVTVIFVDDILSWPVRDAGGILLEGNFVMKPGTSMIQVYMTPKKQKPGYTGEGDVDAEVVPQKFEASAPGNHLELREFIQNTLGKDVILLSGDCQGAEYDMYGTPCSPLRMKPTGVIDDTRTAHDMMFEQPLATGYLPALFRGTIVLADPFEVADQNISLLKANGTQYQLQDNALGTALDIAELDLDDGTVVSLIGDGGVDPFVLSQGAQVGAANVTVVLKDGTDWAAAKNAVLDLRVYAAGATTYLIEQKRG